MNSIQLDRNKMCVCGRLVGIPPHCPACGSTNVYAKGSNSRVIRDSSGDYIASGFKCRRCNCDYSADQPCGAPPPLLSKRQQKAVTAVHEVVEGLRERMATPAGRKLALAELLQKQGAVKDAKLAAAISMENEGIKPPTDIVATLPSLARADGEAYEDKNPIFDLPPPTSDNASKE